MRRVSAVAVLTLTILGLPAQAVTQEERVRPVTGGGISAPGWQGAVDARDAGQGRTIKDTRLAKEGDALHATTGPAANYWNPANTAQGDYTVKATFTEPKYMNLNDHPHPYGVFIGGNALSSAPQRSPPLAGRAGGAITVGGVGRTPPAVSGGHAPALAARRHPAG